ncbi:MAG: hypothetical protein WDZ41_05325 [Candidatus Babeliales bacterium]
MYKIINKAFFLLFFNMNFIVTLAMEKKSNNIPKIIGFAIESKDNGVKEPKLSAIQRVQQMKASQDHNSDNLYKKKRYSDLRQRRNTKKDSDA